MTDSPDSTTRATAALIAACDRICGVNSRYHKDRCPLYKANCEALAASRRFGEPMSNESAVSCQLGQVVGPDCLVRCAAFDTVISVPPATTTSERVKALNEAWQAVDRAIRPLGYGGGATNSPWNQGYEQAKNEALNAILAVRDGT